MSIEESTYQGMAHRIDQLEERNSGLEAARIAYASEFPLNSEGEPDVESIHQNIRKLKADYAQLEAELAESQAALKMAREWSKGDKWRFSEVAQEYSAWENYVDVLDAAIKEQQ